MGLPQYAHGPMGGILVWDRSYRPARGGPHIGCRLREASTGTRR